MTAPLTPGRRTLLTFGVPLSLAFIGYGALGIVNAIGLTHYSESRTLVPTAHVLTVNAGEGSVRLEPSPDGNVHVSAKGVYSLSRPRLITSVTGTSVTVTGKECLGGILICSQDIRVQVPASFRISAYSAGGGVRASGLTGDLVLTSAAGDVRVEGLTGKLTLSSSAGDVHGDALRSTEVTASSSAGDVSLTFAVDPTRVDATSSAGDVRVRVPNTVSYRVTTQSSGGDRVSTVHENSDSARTINARSSAGDVSVRPSG
jgi:hypothetical protein